MRTVFNGECSHQSVRRLAPLLVFLLILPSLGGCLGGLPITWGEGNDEYHATLNENESGVPGATISNKMGSPGTLDEWRMISGCESSPEAAPEPVKLSGWLVQTKLFDQPSATESTGGGTTSVASWVIKMMPYSQAQDQDPGSLYFKVQNDETDWAFPTTVYGYEAIENSANGATITDEFPFSSWAVLGLVPSHENIFEGVVQMEPNQAVEIEGWILHTYTINKTGVVSHGGADLYGEIDDDCNIKGNSVSPTAKKGAVVQLVVTSITYGDERVVNSNEEYVAGDVPIFGRGLYTTLLLVSIVASGALYIFSRNQIILSADSQAQSMLSESQMRAGKSARHEAARHEARMAASQKEKESEYTGKPRKKSTAAPTFDIGAALAEETPGASTGHYVAGSSVTSTDEADAMQDMIVDMQEEKAFEQELQEKGLRNIIGGMPRSGSSRRNIPASRQTSQVTKVAEPEPKPEPKADPPKMKTRRTRKTSVQEEPVEEEDAPPPRREDPEVNDDGDFSDFSL